MGLNYWDNKPDPVQKLDVADKRCLKCGSDRLRWNESTNSYFYVLCQSCEAEHKYWVDENFFELY